MLTGLILSTAIVFEHAGQFPAYLQPRSIGNLHLTWSSLLHPNTTDDIGYLVLQTPVAVADSLPESEDGNSCWVALTIQRNLHSLKPGSIGAVCCARCNRPISPQRLLAVPNTRICTNCKQKKEKNT
ncbi:MAG TPA: TraR/DksA C4-type zinc finger protein [Bryobacteraceae bacterium]|nr:TraR/DksA C4-type zinc finger protein [Bryobacteraceae bacterium]